MKTENFQVFFCPDFILIFFLTGTAEVFEFH